MSGAKDREEVHRHSGWLIPAAFFCFVLLLSGLWLGWYLRPGPKPAAAPTGRSTLVKLSVRGIPFSIPANYIESSTAQAGGEMESVRLVAQFPSWRGYSADDARLFAGNAPDSPVIRLSLRGSTNSLSGSERLERIYMPYIIAPKGEKAPFGLTQYGFVRDSGYENNDLFAGESAKGPVLFLCERASADFPSPSCLAVDRPLARNLSFSYRFKRAYLARWRELTQGTEGLIARFRQH
jgi:hypothetical protein